MRMVLFDLGNTLEKVENDQDVLLSGAIKTLEAIQAMTDADGVSPVLALLSDFGEIPATPQQVAASQIEYFTLLEKLGIRNFFEPLTQRVTLSTEAGAAKPERKIFETAINKIPGLRFSDTIFITENKNHVLEARLLKMLAIHFKGPGQTTGDVKKLTDLIPLIQQFLNPSTP